MSNVKCRCESFNVLLVVVEESVKTPVWVFRTRRAPVACRKPVPFTDVKSTMANNKMALSKRPRNIPTHNETVCASIAAARAPQAASKKQAPPPCTLVS
eukprot:scaffold4883_cov119-Isochrysis_galbana.AAC.2